MSELSVFVDESGDFGSTTVHCPFYIVSLVLHDQRNPISNQIQHFQEKGRREDWDKYGPVHTAPLIRREGCYSVVDGATRKKIFDALFTFAQRCDITHKSILVKRGGSVKAICLKTGSHVS